MTSPSHRLCPSCQSDNIGEPASPYSKDEWEIKDCPACRFVYLENAPAYEALKVDFAWEKTSAKERVERKAAEPVKLVVSDVAKTALKRILKRDKLPRRSPPWRPKAGSRLPSSISSTASH